jgi:hypothetical protein
VIFLVALGAAPAAHAQSLTIEARGNADRFGTVRNVGGFKPVRDPRLRAAIAAYGTPSRRVGAGSEVCRVSWADIGAKLLFANFGGVDACRPANGLVQGGRLSGRAGAPPAACAWATAYAACAPSTRAPSATATSCGSPPDFPGSAPPALPRAGGMDARWARALVHRPGLRRRGLTTPDVGFAAG